MEREDRRRLLIVASEVIVGTAIVRGVKIDKTAVDAITASRRYINGAIDHKSLMLVSDMFGNSIGVDAILKRIDPYLAKIKRPANGTKINNDAVDALHLFVWRSMPTAMAISSKKRQKEWLRPAYTLFRNCAIVFGCDQKITKMLNEIVHQPLDM